MLSGLSPHSYRGAGIRIPGQLLPTALALFTIFLPSYDVFLDPLLYFSPSNV